MKDIILKYLEKTGKTSEFDLFFNLFKKIPVSEFALIKISGETLEYDIKTIADDIAFLSKMGLCPIIVHGGGTSLNKRLSDSKKIDGIRITLKEDIKIVQETFEEIALELQKNIIQFGGRAKIVKNSIFADFLNREKYGFVGSVKSVDIQKIKEVINDGHIPIISPLGISKEGNLNINADTIAREVVNAMNIRKLIFITETGGILDEEGNIIPFLNIASDRDKSFITQGMRLKLNEIEKFLKENENIFITITSAKSLLQELFTIKGAGTVLKNHIIKKVNKYEDADIEKLKILLEDAFEKTLVRDFFDEKLRKIYFQKDYDAVAIVKKINDIPYLCKFAVSKVRQNTGIGKALWQEVEKENHSLIWRSRRGNNINSFYLSKSDGMMKKGKWVIFWKNIPDNKILIKIIEKVANKRESFI